MIGNGIRLRSLLFTAATKPERFARAAAVGADALIIDLEDSVALTDKDQARQAALTFLASTARSAAARILRINALDTHAGVADVLGLLDSVVDPDFVLLPKVDTAAHLQILDRLFTSAGKQARLIALIETAQAMSAIDAIAIATPRLEALVFGAADMAADLGAAAAWPPLLGIRTRIVAAAALGRLPVIDSPFFDFKDTAGLERETASAVALGFTGKAAIHPDQVAVINAALTPSDDAVAHARAILAENEKGAGAVTGVMIDEAVARQARRTLKAAGKMA